MDRTHTQIILRYQFNVQRRINRRFSFVRHTANFAYLVFIDLPYVFKCFDTTIARGFVYANRMLIQLWLVVGRY